MSSFQPRFLDPSPSMASGFDVGAALAAIKRAAEGNLFVRETSFLGSDDRRYMYLNGMFPTPELWAEFLPEDK